MGESSERQRSRRLFTELPGSGSPDLRQPTGQKVSLDPGNTTPTNRDKIVAVQP